MKKLSMFSSRVAVLMVGVMLGAGIVAALLHESAPAPKRDAALELIAARLAQLQVRGDELARERSKFEAAIRAVDDRISRVISRYVDLEAGGLELWKEISAAEEAYSSFGFVLSRDDRNYKGLIAALQQVQGMMRKEMPVISQQQVTVLDERISLLRLKQAEAAKSVRTVD